MGNTISPPNCASEIWSFVTEIGKAERDFNSLQAGYRKLASTWFIAVFGGLGFLLKPVGVPGGEIQLGFEEPLLVVGLSFAGYIGILVLWLVDIAVYHGLLVSYFRQGRKLEETHTWLPQVRHAMAGIPAIVVATAFYVLLATAAFGGPLLVLYRAGKDLPYEWLGTLVGVLDLIVLGAAVWMRRNV